MLFGSVFFLLSDSGSFSFEYRAYQLHKKLRKCIQYGHILTGNK